MIVQTFKSVSLKFHSRRNIADYMYYSDDIQTCNEVKYLGNLLDTILNWDSHIEQSININKAYELCYQSDENNID